MKIYITALLLFISLVSFGQAVQDLTITVDGTDRDFKLYVPSSYNPSSPAPLVFCFHGYGSNANTNFSYTGFRFIADTAGFVLIHPQGSLDITGTPHFNVGWGLSNIDDIAFTQAMIDYARDNYNINSDRIYSTGMSNGGFMSYQLACQLSNEIAAIASVTGSMSPQTFNNCNATHPTPVLQIHGTADGTVPYDGDPLFTEAIDDVMLYWVNYNNCNSIPETTPIDDINTNDQSTVDHLVYGNGANGSTVELFKVYGGDHDWPGVFGNMDINASIEVWKFFSRFDKNGALSVYENEALTSFKISPNPVQDVLKITHTFEKESLFRILSIDGKEMMSGKMSHASHSVNLSALKSGAYLFVCEGAIEKFILK